MDSALSSYRNDINSRKAVAPSIIWEYLEEIGLLGILCYLELHDRGNVRSIRTWWPRNKDCRFSYMVQPTRLLWPRVWYQVICGRQVNFATRGLSKFPLIHALLLSTVPVNLNFKGMLNLLWRQKIPGKRYQCSSEKPWIFALFSLSWRTMLSMSSRNIVGINNSICLLFLHVNLTTTSYYFYYWESWDVNTCLLADCRSELLFSKLVTYCGGLQERPIEFV